MQPAEAAPTLPPRRAAVAHAWLASPVYQQLKFEAERYGDHPDRLASSILTAVLVNGYIDAVLRPTP